MLEGKKKAHRNQLFPSILHQIFEGGHLTLKLRHGHIFCNSEQLYSVLNGGDTETCYTPSVLRNSKILSALNPGSFASTSIEINTPGEGKQHGRISYLREDKDFLEIASRINENKTFNNKQVWNHELIKKKFSIGC
ncbi:unnamed protein product [Lactuca virosa]|uniref:Uncharacterized protein n=1 Tax=Lactuca virosa TaxID=75947 RepID=A0AAU9MZI7_9ASTR|nr:unnamed protein product [Lactuca virosa]